MIVGGKDVRNGKPKRQNMKYFRDNVGKGRDGDDKYERWKGSRV